MKTIVLGLMLSLACLPITAQNNNDASAPASKEDVQRYMEVMHSRQMASQMIDAMLKPLHQMVHQRYLKDKDKLPSDFEARENKSIDEMFKDMPWEEMLQVTVPVYQKHFTKGDIDYLIAFYSSSTGQKMIRELPAIMGESMEAMTPIIQRYEETVQHRVDEEFAQAMKDSEKKEN